MPLRISSFDPPTTMGIKKNPCKKDKSDSMAIHFLMPLPFSSKQSPRFCGLLTLLDPALLLSTF